MTNSATAAQFLRGEYGISGMKLQKILYYAQAMALITRAAPLFPEEFEAWRHGPVNREVWQETGIPDQPLSAEEVAVLRAAWEKYGHLTAYELSDLSHADAPWQEARRGLADGENCTRVIPQGVMENFYLARELVQRADGTWEHQAPTEEEWQQAKLRLVLQRRKRGAHKVAHEQFLREQVVATQRLEGITVPAQYGG